LEKDRAKKAKQFTVQALRDAKVIKLNDMERGKYFRILAVITVDGQNLGMLLIKNNLAVEYDGGIKVDWCLKFKRSERRIF